MLISQSGVDASRLESRTSSPTLGNLNRRSWLKTGVASMALCGTTHLRAQDAVPEQLAQTRVITQGPHHHWFGYYDKLQFDPSNRFVLGMQVDFEHRTPTPADIIQIGMVDLEDNDRWIPLGESRAWNWQQGCMLQWLPGSDSKVLWNDRQSDRYVCHILDINTREKNTCPYPVYCVSPDGKLAMSPDFARIGDVRPGYGYAGIADRFVDDLAPRESGIWRVQLDTGMADLVISVAQIAELGEIPNPEPDVKHYFNHLLFSPDGKRFIALHRWRYANGSRLTRMITATPDGGDVRIVIPNGYASHFIWRDSTHILAQSKNWLGNDQWSNFLFEDKPAGIVEEVGKGILDPSGHMTYLRNREWILSDTYPKGVSRLQTPHLYHIATQRRIDLGHFHVPTQYTGEWRVDTHPRLSRDEKLVCIDAPHADSGRQLHLITL
jgi:hypothetical protein